MMSTKYRSAYKVTPLLVLRADAARPGARAHHSSPPNSTSTSRSRCTGRADEDGLGQPARLDLHRRQAAGRQGRELGDRGGRSDALLRRGLRKTDFPAGIEVDGRRLSRQERRAEGERPVRHHEGRTEFLPRSRGRSGRRAAVVAGFRGADPAGSRCAELGASSSVMGRGTTGVNHLKPRSCAPFDVVDVALVARVLPRFVRVGVTAIAPPPPPPPPPPAPARRSGS